jgi:hypothetical protein
MCGNVGCHRVVGGVGGTSKHMHVSPVLVSRVSLADCLDRTSLVEVAGEHRAIGFQGTSWGADAVQSQVDHQSTQL